MQNPTGSNIAGSPGCTFLRHNWQQEPRTAVWAVLRATRIRDKPWLVFLNTHFDNQFRAINGAAHQHLHLCDTNETTYHDFGRATQPIDWVLISRHFWMRIVAIDAAMPCERYPSDHYSDGGGVEDNSPPALTTKP